MNAEVFYKLSYLDATDGSMYELMIARGGRIVQGVDGRVPPDAHAYFVFQIEMLAERGWPDTLEAVTRRCYDMNVQLVDSDGHVVRKEAWKPPPGGRAWWGG